MLSYLTSSPIIPANIYKLHNPFKCSLSAPVLSLQQSPILKNQAQFPFYKVLYHDRTSEYNCHQERPCLYHSRCGSHTLRRRDASTVPSAISTIDSNIKVVTSVPIIATLASLQPFPSKAQSLHSGSRLVRGQAMLR